MWYLRTSLLLSGGLKSKAPNLVSSWPQRSQIGEIATLFVFDDCHTNTWTEVFDERRRELDNNWRTAFYKSIWWHGVGLLRGCLDILLEFGYEICRFVDYTDITIYLSLFKLCIINYYKTGMLVGLSVFCLGAITMCEAV